MSASLHLILCSVLLHAAFSTCPDDPTKKCCYNDSFRCDAATQKCCDQRCIPSTSKCCAEKECIGPAPKCYNDPADAPNFYTLCKPGDVCQNIPVPGTRYMMVIGCEKTWLQAKTYCNTIGKLAFVPSLEAHKQIVDFADTYNVKRIWIGLNDKASEGNFVWAYGNTPYRNWKDGVQPSSSSKDCVQMQEYYGWKWNHDSCSKKKEFVCYC